jgi:ABC-type polysaccharide/polyol phosphate transport system ATPase subunit
MTNPDPLATTPAPDFSDKPVVISVKGVNKTFRIPLQKVESIKERAVHPFRKQQFRELRALQDIDFEVRQGEFFGIVGRNGSGKSTLLKILASIYKADTGRVQIAGRLAPFIELGVGFNYDLTAYDNVVMNGVMMGLSRQEAAQRLSRVVEFAELEDFTELKLKNYSSGMMVRLAFSLMMQADADLMLIDEVLAVGDASFQQKCADAFATMRDAGKTIILVTHDMAAVENFCHRAMLIENGRMIEHGEPRSVARSYLRTNFSEESRQVESMGLTEAGEAVEEEFNAESAIQSRRLDAWLENEDGERVTNVEVGTPLRFGLTLQAIYDLENPLLSFQISNPNHVQVLGFTKTFDIEEGQEDLIPAGDRITIRGEVENQLTPGRYIFACWLTRNRGAPDRVVQGIPMFEFMVFGLKNSPGLVEANAEVDAKFGAEAKPIAEVDPNE